jgi:dienelactone hydrolase
MGARWLVYGLLLMSWSVFGATQWVGQPIPMELYKPQQGPFSPADPVAPTINRPASANPDNSLALPVTITYPRDGLGPFPVIAFSHRYRGTMHDFAPMVRQWVSHGYVVLQPQHRDSRDCEENCVADFLQQDDRAAELAAVIQQLDEVLAAVPGLAAKVDHHIAGLAGYGFGANTAQVVGNSQYVDPSGQTLTIPAGAVFALSPPANYVGESAAARADQILGGLGSDLRDSIIDLLGVTYPLQPSAGSLNPLMVVTGGDDDVYRSFFIEKISPGLLPWVYNRNPWYDSGTGDGFLTTDSWRWRIDDYGTVPSANRFLLVIAGAQQNFGGASGQAIAPVSPTLLEQCSQALQSNAGQAFASAYNLTVDLYNTLFGLVNLSWDYPIKSIAPNVGCDQVLIDNGLSWDEGDPNAPAIREDLYATSIAFFDSYLKRIADARVYLATDITCLATRQSALYYHSGYGEPEGGVSGLPARSTPPAPATCTNR